MRNPDFLRLFDGFCKSIFSDNQWLGKIKAREGTDFFSENFYQVCEEILWSEENLWEFLTWIREELICREHVLLDLRKKYSSEKITDFLMLLFYLQKEIENNSEEEILPHIFQTQVRKIIHEMNGKLSESNLNVRQSIITGVERWYFPISSKGEILIFIQEVQTWVAQSLSFPSSIIVTTKKNWAIINENWEPIHDEDEEDNDEDGTQRDFCDWLFRDEDIENMDIKELEIRIEIMRKWIGFHTWKWTILSRNEEFAYRIEYNTWYDIKGSEDEFEEISLDKKRYYNSLFEDELKEKLKNLERVYSMKKNRIQVVK